MTVYMMSAEGVHTYHDGARGPVEPVPQKGKRRGGGHLAEGASWKVIHDAGIALIVEVEGPQEWEQEYILPLKGACASQSWAEFLDNVLAASQNSKHLTHTLAAAVIASMGDTVDRQRTKAFPQMSLLNPGLVKP